jgi:hypothetical protein
MRRFLFALCTVVLAVALVVLVWLEATGLPERVLSAPTPYSAARDQACVDFAPTGWWSHVLMTLQQVVCAKSYSVVYDDGSQVKVVDFPGRRVLLFGTQVETEVDVDARGRYTAPSQYIRTIAALIRRRFPAPAMAADPGGWLLLMGVGGGSLFMELLLHNFTWLQVCVRLPLNRNSLNLFRCIKQSASLTLGVGAGSCGIDAGAGL